MSIDGEGAGKGDTYRPVNRAVYNENFDFIFRKKDPPPAICESCGWEIDPDVCHCGGEIKKHDQGCGHSPVPMGCTCGYPDAAEMRNPDFKPLTGPVKWRKCPKCDRVTSFEICVACQRAEA
jgi:hypothetical protein